jgi:hypothetical protein
MLADTRFRSRKSSSLIGLADVADIVAATTMGMVRRASTTPPARTEIATGAARSSIGQIRAGEISRLDQAPMSTECSNSPSMVAMT